MGPAKLLAKFHNTRSKSINSSNLSPLISPLTGPMVEGRVNRLCTGVLREKRMPEGRVSRQPSTAQGFEICLSLSKCGIQLLNTAPQENA
jgi:hypothetical protein